VDSGHDSDEVLEPHWLRDERVHTKIVGLYDVFLARRRCQDDNRNPAQVGVRLDGLEHLDAVYPRKVQIEEDEAGKVVWPVPQLFKDIKRLLTVSRHCEPVSQLALVQRPLRDLHVVRIVLHQKDVYRLQIVVHSDSPLVVRWA